MTTHERRIAPLQRAAEEKGEYILIVHFDNTEISCLRHTISYVYLRIKTPGKLDTIPIMVIITVIRA